MIPHLFFYQLAVLGLLWLCVMLHAAWPSRCTTAQGTPATPILPRRQRSKEPEPFAGLTHKPSCALCEHEATHPSCPLRCHLSRCPRLTAAPARWTLHDTSVPTPAVAIAAGWGWGIYAPTALPAAASGGHFPVPAVVGTFLGTTAP